MNKKIPHKINFPKIGDSSTGYISVAEASKNVPFDVKRIYWTYFTPESIDNPHCRALDPCGGQWTTKWSGWNWSSSTPLLSSASSS